MTRGFRLACVLTVAASIVAAASAQSGGKPVKGGNPTPGTPQPDPPNLADRITLTGCVQVAPGRSESVDANTPTGTRFMLTNAERLNVNPPGTGGSDAAASVSGRIIRLEGIERLLSPFVGAKVEVSGEVKLRAAGSRGEGVGSNLATLQVEFIQKIAASCR